MVNLVDPNAFIAKSITGSNNERKVRENSIPIYENMSIFVSLKIERRNKVLFNINGSTTTVTNQSSVTDQEISLMGFDPKRQEYTTNYTENIGADPERPIYEGFGIKSINIKQTSSYVPQVTIELIDTLSLQYFNRGVESPYSAIDEFPPPVFTLRVKGYYGKAIQYKLHLQSSNRSFDTSTGNSIIKLELIGLHFGALTDITVQQLKVAPFMSTSANLIDTNGVELTIDPKPNTPPRSFWELAMKAKTLYTNVNDYQANSKNLETLSNDREIIERYNESINLFRNIQSAQNNSYDDSIGAGNTNIEFDFYQFDPVNDSRSARQLSRLNKPNPFSNITSSTQLGGNNQQIIGVTPNKNISNFSYTDLFVVKIKDEDSVSDLSDTVTKIKAGHNQHIETVLSIAFDTEPSNISSSDRDLFEIVDLEDIDGKKIYGINGTGFVKKIQDEINTLRDSQAKLSSEVTQEVNDIVLRDLGFYPTLGNVLKIICDDMDIFFKALRQSGANAQKIYSDPSQVNKINSNVNVLDNTKIEPYPLVIENRPEGNTSREVKKYLGAIKGTANFGEVRFVEDFINTVLLVNRIDNAIEEAKAKDIDGNEKNFPISFFDSNDKSINPNISNNGYLSVIAKNSGNQEGVAEIIKVIVLRAMLLATYSYDNLFYLNTAGLFVDDNFPYPRFYGKADASNLANSLFNLKQTETIDEVLKFFRRQGSSQFDFNTFRENFLNLQQLDTIDIGNYKLENNRVFISDNEIYRDYKNPQAKNLAIIDSVDINLRETNSGDNSEIIEEVLIDLQNNTALGEFFNTDTENKELRLTENNTVILRDMSLKESNKGNFVNRYKSDFFGDAENIDSLLGLSTFQIGELIIDLTDKDSFILNQLLDDRLSSTFQSLLEVVFNNDTTNQGYRQRFIKLATTANRNSVDNSSASNDIELVFFQMVNTLLYPIDNYRNNGREFYKTLLTKLTEGYSLIEFPKIVLLHLGNLLKNKNRLPKYSDFDIDISQKDKEEIIDYYDKNFFRNNSFRTIVRTIYDSINSPSYISGNSEDIKNRIYSEFNRLVNGDVYSIFDKVYLLKNNSLVFREDIAKAIDRNLITNLSEKSYTLDNYKNIFTQNRFINLREFIDPNNNILLSDSPYNTTELLQPLEVYFENFHKRLTKFNQEKKKKFKNDEKEIKSVINDMDLKSDIYYMFKSLNDRWLIDEPNPYDTNLSYPFLTEYEGYDSSYSLFRIVDRVFNDISGVEIDAFGNSTPTADGVLVSLRPILDFIDSPKTSVFTLIDALLRENNFQFFPLQSFIDYSVNSSSGDVGWGEDIFGLQLSDAIAPPAFVCMYIGGNATIQSGSSDIYKGNDIVDIANVKNAPTDFQNANTKVFSVKFGQQNQSVFKSFEVSSEEFKETWESTEILANIAKDNSRSAPPAKGQNLFNIYEQRSYSSTVTQMGNMMIQPTMYYQIENVPIFRGVYIILQVEHSITPNNIETKFKGTKIARFPAPLLTAKNADSLLISVNIEDALVTTILDSVSTPFGVESSSGLDPRGRTTSTGQNRNVSINRSINVNK